MKPSGRKKGCARDWDPRPERDKVRKEILNKMDDEGADIIALLEPRNRRVSMENYHMFKQIYHDKITTEDLEDLADELFAWYKVNNHVLKATQFLVDNCIDYSMFYEWRKVCRKLDLAWKHVKMSIGNKREDAAYNRTADAKVVLFTLANYCPEASNMLKEQREQAQGGPQEIRVFMDKVDNSPLVPLLKDADGREESSSEELPIQEEQEV